MASLADEEGYRIVSTTLSRLRKPECILGKGGFAVVLRYVRRPPSRSS